MIGPQRQELKDWMVRLADGERAAFDPLFQALWPVVRGFCRRQLDSDADAEDAAQQALLNLFARACEFDPARDALAWALGIAAYECLTVRRRRFRQREQALPADEALLEPAPSQEQSLAARQLAESVRELLGSLSSADEEVLLANLGEVPRPAVAAATFRKRLERALARLRSAWRSRHEVP